METRQHAHRRERAHSLGPVREIRDGKCQMFMLSVAASLSSRRFSLNGTVYNNTLLTSTKRGFWIQHPTILSNNARYMCYMLHIGSRSRSSFPHLISSDLSLSLSYPERTGVHYTPLNIPVN